MKKRVLCGIFAAFAAFLLWWFFWPVSLAEYGAGARNVAASCRTYSYADGVPHIQSVDVNYPAGSPEYEAARALLQQTRCRRGWATFLPNTTMTSRGEVEWSITLAFGGGKGFVMELESTGRLRWDGSGSGRIYYATPGFAAAMRTALFGPF